MLEFLRELMRTQNVEREPFKSLWATAALYAADWEAHLKKTKYMQYKVTAIM